jgi:hypothetical protein
MRLSLATRPFPRTLELHRRVPGAERRTAPDAADLCVRVEHAIRRAARFVPGARCLARALAGQALLSRRGVATDLRIGVTRREEKGLVAHAWLEREEQVILGGRTNGEYTPLRDNRELAP